MGVVVSIAIRYLLARMRQSLLTVGGIAVGVVALTVIQAMMGGAREAFVRKTLSSSAHVVVRRRALEPFEPTSPTRTALRAIGGPLLVPEPRPPIPDEKERINSPDMLERRIREIPGVAETAPTVAGRLMLGFHGLWEPVTVNGVIPSRQSRITDFAANFRGGRPDDLERNPNGVVLGSFLAERMRTAVGDRVVARSKGGGVVTLRVVALHQSGIYDTDNSSVWVNLHRGQALLDLGSSVNTLLVRTTDYDRADAIARQIEYAIGIKAESWMEANQNTLNLMRMFIAIMFVVTGFTMLVAGFGIAGNLVTTVSEKSFDIGVLKAMGMRAADISRIFLVLALLMTAMGLVLGLSLSYGLIEIIGNTPSAVKPMPGVIMTADTIPVSKSWTLYAISAVFASLISFGAGLSPAARAARLEPLNIIRNAAG